MKLISCYIENFGRISDFSYDFRDDINIICKENGWGKSTFLTFIKVMLYGFANESKQSKIVNERKKYKPWQGGTYGGKLKIEINNKKYEISRVFYDKNKDDEFAIKDISTNILSKDFTTNIGEEIFKIDHNSFLRTVFLSQSDCETNTTDGINAKIGNLAENTDDINNFEEVSKKLKNILNSMSPTRKTGSINKMKSERNLLEEKVKEGEIIDNSVTELIKKKEDKKQLKCTLLDKQRELQQKQLQISVDSDIKTKKDMYMKLCDEFNLRQIKYNELAMCFPNGVPKKEDLSKYISESNKITAENKSISIFSLTKQEETELLELKECILQIPNENEIKDINNKINMISEYETVLKSTCLSIEDNEQLLKLEKQFDNEIPSINEVESCIYNYKRMIEKNNSLATKQSTLNALTNMSHISTEIPMKKSNYKVFVAIIGVLLIIAGVFGIINQVEYGYAGFIMGILVAVFYVLINIKSKRNNINNNSVREYKILNTELIEDTNNQIHKLEKEISEDISFIDRTKKEVSVLLNTNDICFDDDNAIIKLQEIKVCVDQYRNLVDKKNSLNSNSNNELRNQVNKLNNEVFDFFNKTLEKDLFVNKDSKSVITDFEKKVEIYKRLTNKENQYNISLKELARINNVINMYLSTLSITRSNNIQEQLLELQSKLVEYNTAFEEYINSKNAKDKFEVIEDVARINNFNENIDGKTMHDIDKELKVIFNEIEDINRNISDYNRQLDELCDKQEVINDAERRLLELNEDYSTNIMKYNLINKTNELLERAKNTFTAKYMGPISNSFLKYYEMITNCDGNKYSLDANMQITKEEFGISRDVQAQSKGNRDLIGICMRMALIEAMYKDEVPFIIFDDPFVNLDLERTNNALLLLNNIAKDYQVIYVTCHESRKALIIE